MKTNLLPVIALLAAIAAFALLPVSAAAASIAVSVTGLASLLTADYGRNLEPVRAPAPIVPFGMSRPSLADCRAAA
jgi:hypothetical protein